MPLAVTVDCSLPPEHPDHLAQEPITEDEANRRWPGRLHGLQHDRERDERRKARASALAALRNHPDPVIAALAEHL